MTHAAMAAAIICVVASLSIPVGAVPVTLATLAVMIAGALLGPGWGTAATAVYLIAGIAGLPIFAGFRGGAGVLAGPTGGYLAGYLALAAISGIRIKAAENGTKPLKAAIRATLCTAGTAILYTLGTAWYCIVTGANEMTALAVCVVPFLPGDAAKIAVCVLLTLAIPVKAEHKSDHGGHRMKYSDKLNGFWEEGYHYYIEIRDNKMNVLDYHRRPMLETAISYDAQKIEKGEPAAIELDDNVLSRTAFGEPMTMIRKLTYIDGRLELLYYYTIMGETLYTLKKVDHGPFDYLRIRDKEMLGELQGKWIECDKNGLRDAYLTFSGDRMKYVVSGDFVWIDSQIHVCETITNPGTMFITPADLSMRDFGSINEIEIGGNVLTTYMHICDAESRRMMFVKEEIIDRLKLPPEAQKPSGNTMLR